jgi:hypothetical protein
MKWPGILLYALLAVALVAQEAREGVPLKNWSTPLYWQPNRMERETTAKPTPQLQFSGSAVSLDALTFVAVTPCRLVDTRGSGAGFNGNQPFGGPSIAGAGTATFPVQLGSEASANTEPAPCGVIPPIAAAYSFNVTVVPHGGGVVGYVSIWPAGSAQPAVATLNDREGVVIANAAIVPAGTPNGGVSVYNAGPATIDLIIDMNGFFAAPSDLNNNTAIGRGALANNTTGLNNTAIGESSLGSETTGTDNTAIGFGALMSSANGGGNTAIGSIALRNNTSGQSNTATGYFALAANTTGSNNTANGESALANNTTGTENTATGYEALQDNTTGIDNTAIGLSALQANTTGIDNTASGVVALSSNTTGNQNTADGTGAMAWNTTGGQNTATGAIALEQNTIASGNTAIGFAALESTTIGNDNTAVGQDALQNNTSGSGNIAIGYQAGENAPVANSNSIYIGSPGNSGDASGTIQIGSQGTQTGGTFIAGVSGATSSGGIEVLINNNGQLGTMTSSGRFKEQITDMGDASSKLLQLRPVNFYYKPEYDDGSHLLQYGLVAEEVAKIYPEMVAYGRDGKALTVRYQLLAPMLLNEVKKQAEQNRLEAEENKRQDERIRGQDERIRSLEHRLAALEALMPTAPTPAP